MISSRYEKLNEPKEVTNATANKTKTIKNILYITNIVAYKDKDGNEQDKKKEESYNYPVLDYIPKIEKSFDKFGSISDVQKIMKIFIDFHKTITETNVKLGNLIPEDPVLVELVNGFVVIFNTFSDNLTSCLSVFSTDLNNKDYIDNFSNIFTSNQEDLTTKVGIQNYILTIKPKLELIQKRGIFPLNFETNVDKIYDANSKYKLVKRDVFKPINLQISVEEAKIDLIQTEANAPTIFPIFMQTNQYNFYYQLFKPDYLYINNKSSNIELDENKRDDHQLSESINQTCCFKLNYKQKLVENHDKLRILITINQDFYNYLPEIKFYMPKEALTKIGGEGSAQSQFRI